MRHKHSLIILPALLFLLLALAPRPGYAAPPVITALTDNRSSYPGGAVPRYSKFELTFQLQTQAENLQLPYDAAPPPGMAAGIGVTVNAHFTPDNWQTVFIQPAFYYQPFDTAVKSNAEWFYPQDNFAWKVRFAPDQTGTWQYKLVAEDAGGVTETEAYTVNVTPGTEPGFLQVSPADSRYFAYENGDYFPALGYNLNYRNMDWINPTLANEEQFRIMQENGIQLVRAWLSQWAIYGAAWNPWRSHNPAHNLSGPDPRLRHDGVTPAADQDLAVPGSDSFLWLSYDETVFDGGMQWNFNPCMVYGWEAAPLPLERNSDYRLRVRYRELDLTGPRVGGEPFGFAVKTGTWLWDNNDVSRRCDTPGVGDLLAASYSDTSSWRSYADPEHAGWRILEGDFNSGNRDFLDRLYLVMENVTGGSVLVDTVWLEEDLGGGSYGPNVVYKPWMAHQYYYDQRNAFAMDQLLALAETYDIYLKLVIHEKQDYALNIFNPDGSLTDTMPPQNNYALFYGDGRAATKTRWLQQAWWRYLQARWGYSAHIHSWELLNEGNPGLPLHYILADELGKYMQTAFIPDDQSTPHPNTHMVTTSFWNSFPNAAFWSNDAFPHIDYADVHHYANPDSTGALGAVYELSDYNDAALFSQKLSAAIGAQTAGGADMPVMRGETGWLFNGADLFANDAAGGVWLHNLIWAGINDGGLIESYWVGAPTTDHIYRDGSHDYRPSFRPYYNFIRDVPLANGRYRALDAQSSTPGLRVWGQQDILNGAAHFWLQNSAHTWRNVVDNASIPPANGVVTLNGFPPGESVIVQWWDTRETNPARQITAMEVITADNAGRLMLTVSGLQTDVAAKLLAFNPVSSGYLPFIGRDAP